MKPNLDNGFNPSIRVGIKPILEVILNYVISRLDYFQNYKCIEQHTNIWIEILHINKLLMPLECISQLIDKVVNWNENFWLLLR